MWEKIVLNLLSNAFKFTFEGSIRATMAWRDAHVEFAVSDTGVGIPAEHLAHVFDRFHRVEQSRGRTHEGSGIGLALVRELIAMHGGTVRVSSHVGAGTTFTVSLPFGHAHLPEERLGSSKRTTAAERGAAPFVQEALRWLPSPVTPSAPGPSGRANAPSKPSVVCSSPTTTPTCGSTSAAHPRRTLVQSKRCATAPARLPRHAGNGRTSSSPT